MKKIALALAVLLLLTLPLAVMTSCGSDDADTPKEIIEAEIPAGYVAYENGDIRFAYPESYTKQDGSTVLLIDSTTGNNITVVYENKTDYYDKMTLEKYEEEMIPQFEAMGMTITNPSLEHLNNPTTGAAITKVTHRAVYSGASMKQTMLVLTAGQKTYTVTVTEVVGDGNMLNAVINTLGFDK